MFMSSPRIFSEIDANAWRLAAFLALISAGAAFWFSAELASVSLALALTAGLISFFASMKLPRGTLALWALVLGGSWLSPFASLGPDAQRLVFACAAVYISLVYQGEAFVYFAALVVALGVCARSLMADFAIMNVHAIATSGTIQILQGAMVFGTVAIFVRVAHARSKFLLQQLCGTSDELDKLRARVTLTQEVIQLTRESLLGRARTNGESSDGNFHALASAELAGLDPLEMHTAPLGEIIASLRKAFADFQARGRAAGRIAGPIRFVFFPPVAGYDERSVIAVDAPALLKGLETCLELALQSLPEIGTRRREGVIRLSIRCGLRVIEVAVEDNGRGLTTPHLHIEDGLNELKDLAPKWGGKLDRLTRLGVGSRTALELRIVRTRPRTLPTEFTPALPVAFPVEVGPHA